MAYFLGLFRGWPRSITGISMLAFYHAGIKPVLWSFIGIAVLHRILTYLMWMASASFRPPPPPPLPPRDDVQEENADNPNEVAIVASGPATDEEQAMAWMMTHVSSKDASSTVHKVHRVYELWVPLVLRATNANGIPAWFSMMQAISRTMVIVVAISIAIGAMGVFSYRLAQDPILGLVTCDTEMIDAALHCDPYTESCHLTPSCGSLGLDYTRLVEIYHDSCTGNAYPKITMIKNVCFMEKDGTENSWKHTWRKLVGSDFYALEHLLISYYRNADVSAAHLRELVNEPVRVFYDQIGSLEGYGVNTITPEGVRRTNINYDDLMSILTTWRSKKLAERKRQKPCICAPHLGILSRMIFIWLDDAETWQIYVDHNVSKINSVHGESNLVPVYDDFPHDVDVEIAKSVRREADHMRRGYPAASTIELLEARMDISSVRPVDIQTAQQIRRHWSLEGPVLQSQIPHVYFDASLDAFHHSRGQSVSAMTHRDGVIRTRRMIDPGSACYYQCARIFDEVEVDDVE